MIKIPKQLVWPVLIAIIAMFILLMVAGVCGAQGGDETEVLSPMEARIAALTFIAILIFFASLWIFAPVRSAHTDDQAPATKEDE